MARITVEDCLEKIDNQYDLVLLAKERTTQLNSGSPMLVEEDNDKKTIIASTIAIFSLIIIFYFSKPYFINYNSEKNIIENKIKNLENFSVLAIGLGSEDKEDEINIAEDNHSGSSSIFSPRPSSIEFVNKEKIF